MAKKSIGSIKSKTFRSGVSYLYYRPYKAEKYIASGLTDTPKNRKLVNEILETAYTNYLKADGKIAQTYEHSIFEIHEIYKNTELKKKSERTQRDYKSSFDLIISYDHDINKIGYIPEIEKQVQHYINTNTKHSPVSKNIHIRSLQAFVSWAQRQGYIKIVTSVIKYKLPEEKKEVLNYKPDELKAILSRIVDTEFKILVKLMLHLGLRIKETLDLKWSEIDYEQNHIKLRNKINKTKFNYLPISKQVAELLKELKELKGEKQTEKLFRWKSSTISTLTRWLTEAHAESKGENAKTIKVKGRSFHSLRKTYAQRLVENNVNIYEVQKLMRHEDINTTLKLYSKQEIDKLKATIDSLPDYTNAD